MNLYNHSVLVLNNSFEPISLCSFRRAFILLASQKAEILHNRDNAFVNTVNKKYELPSVIRVFSSARIRYVDVPLSKTNILKRDGFTCQYCGKKHKELTVDHIIPKSRGGADSWKNLITACKPCNNVKDDRTPEEAGMKLLSKPAKPNYVFFLQKFAQHRDKSWEQYLYY